MLEIYPPRPDRVPPELRKASALYRRRAYLAVASLVIFLLLYFGLAGWLGWSAYRFIAEAVRANDFDVFHFVIGAGCAIVSFLMIQGLFFFRRQPLDAAVEVTTDEEPRLFGFLQRIAGETGAPRPHRVFVSPDVNAAVYYDLSIWNLLVPSKKNLVIGLGLINVLNLSELKAVLSHEFGHFAQRTMAVGRWVYTAQQIVGQLVAKRGWVDAFLRGLSRQDVRIAWIGWAIRGAVWAVRSIADTLYTGVALAERALSREMELQADLVAVTMTGSDAIVGGLHKLQAADDAWGRTMSFVARQAADGKRVTDLFAVHSEYISRVRQILADPTYGVVPALADPARERVFKKGMASPPKMWLTHPPSAAREENVKQLYVPCTQDDRPAWLVFEEPDAIRRRVSEQCAPRGEQPLEPLANENALRAVDEGLDLEAHRSTYHGAYLGRFAVEHAGKPNELYGALPPPDKITGELSTLYTDSVPVMLDRLGELSLEHATLRAINERVLEPQGGVIRHRDRELRRRELPTVIAEADAEVSAARAQIAAFDTRCRTAHRAAARQLGGGWEEYLLSAASLLHYADHRLRDIEDAAEQFMCTLRVAVADGRVSRAEVSKLIVCGTELHGQMEQAYTSAAQVTAPRSMQPLLEGKTYAEWMGKLELPPPDEENLVSWIEAIEGWVSACCGSLALLRKWALEELLIAEKTVAQAALTGAPPPAPPSPAPAIAASYNAFLHGQERERPGLSAWDKFQNAQGLVAGSLRFVAAACILGPVVLMTLHC